MKKFANKLNRDLFFCSHLLARILQKIGKEEFGAIGLTPSHAYILMIVNKYPGIGQHELRDLLLLASSTITRFVKNLEKSGYLLRSPEGKFILVYPTDKSKESAAHIELIWDELKLKYKDLLGKKNSKRLTDEMYETALFLGKSFDVI